MLVEIIRTNFFVVEIIPGSIAEGLKILQNLIVDGYTFPVF